MSLKILVVDDEISLRETLTYNLEREGYIVTAAGDGEKALELARRNPPDLIILDLMLPGMDGFDFCRAVANQTFRSSSSQRATMNLTVSLGLRLERTTIFPNPSACANSLLASKPISAP
jgi:CheY-like chemotaxis protein